MVLDFSPEHFISHFSYRFYKKAIYDKAAERTEANAESLETLINMLLDCDNSFKIAGVAQYEELLNVANKYLSSMDGGDYINGTPERFWENNKAQAYFPVVKFPEANIRMVQMVDWQKGKLYQLPETDNQIGIYNLSGYFPYEIKYPNWADMLLIPCNAAIGMEELGGMMLVNTHSTLYNKKEINPVFDNQLLALCNKMFVDIHNQSDLIRRDYNYKWAVLTHAISEHPELEFTIENEKERARSIVTFSCKGNNKVFYDNLADNNIKLGVDSSLPIYRVANFYNHSREQFEKLADVLLPTQA